MCRVGAIRDKAIRDLNEGQDFDPRDQHQVWIEEGIEPHLGPFASRLNVRLNLRKHSERVRFCGNTTDINFVWQVTGLEEILLSVQESVLFNARPLNIDLRFFVFENQVLDLGLLLLDLVNELLQFSFALGQPGGSRRGVTDSLR